MSLADTHEWRTGIGGSATAALAGLKHRILLTGGSGWIGMATLDMLYRDLGPAVAQRVICFGSTRKTLRLHDGFCIEQQPLCELAGVKTQPSIMLHYAYLTRDKTSTQPLSEYVAANRALTKQIVDHAIDAGVDRLFVPSSGAVYNSDRSLCDSLERNPYGYLKLEDERAFSGLALKHGIRLVQIRVFNLSGPYIYKPETFALASLILHAQAGKPMQIRADKPVIRSYTSIFQLVSVALGLLTRGDAEASGIFDTAGAEVVELEALAHAINNALGTAVPVLRAPILNPVADHYVGDGAEYFALSEQLGVKQPSLREQILQTAAYLSNRQSSS